MILLSLSPYPPIPHQRLLLIGYATLFLFCLCSPWLATTISHLAFTPPTPSRLTPITQQQQWLQQHHCQDALPRMPLWHTITQQQHQQTALLQHYQYLLQHTPPPITFHTLTLSSHQLHIEGQSISLSPLTSWLQHLSTTFPNSHLTDIKKDHKQQALSFTLTAQDP